MQKAASKLLVLFDGLRRAYGEFKIVGKSAQGKITGRATTRMADLTDSKLVRLWEEHLAGRAGLGIIPICDDNTCWWGCIDIDVNTINHAALEARINEAGLPLVVARSKSGGAHCFVFFNEPADAATVRSSLSEWAAWLGHGGCEIFPKQEKLANENDVGNWLNMPYFDAEMPTRVFFHDGEPILDVDDAIEYGMAKRISPYDLADYQLPVPDNIKEEHSGIPPCLELLMASGFPSGTRNEGLFNLGVYCKQRWPEDWETKIEEMNYRYMQPPLPSAEVQSVVKSIKRVGKEYFYKCSSPPISTVCNKPKCYTREFGVGFAGASIEVSSLTKLCTEPPIWTVQVNGRRIQVETADLLMQERFRRKCFEALNILPKKMKASAWEALINELTQTIHVIDDVPKDLSQEERMVGFILEFIQSCSVTDDRSALRSNHRRIYLDDSTTTPYGWFKSQRLFEFLERKRYNIMPENKVYSVMRRRLGCKHKGFNVNGSYVNCWGIPMTSEGEPLILAEDTDAD